MLVRNLFGSINQFKNNVQSQLMEKKNLLILIRRFFSLLCFKEFLQSFQERLFYFCPPKVSFPILSGDVFEPHNITSLKYMRIDFKDNPISFKRIKVLNIT